jgi:ribonucleoside-diphosphate reductase alpha chain
MRWLASRFVDGEIQEELGILTEEVRARKAAEEATRPRAGNGHGTNGHGTNGHAGDSTDDEEETSNEGPVPPTTALTDSPPVHPAKLEGLDLGPACSQCGGMMQRTGSCYTCASCGNNTGCG